MKQKLLLCLITVATVALAKAQKEINPVMEKFGDDITFFVNFDDSNEKALLAGGEKTVKSTTPKLIFETGLFGKALQNGSISYHMQGNLDFSKPGTLIFWATPLNWKEVEKEPYIIPLIAHNDECKILVGRQGDAWGKSRIYTFVEAADRQNNIYNGIIGGSGKDWNNGEWRMIALTWTPENIGISQNGAPAREISLKQPLTRQNNGWFSFTATDRENQQILLDELVVLNRKLTNDELKSLYDETMKRVKK